jgi:Transposase zinc-ribbon domain
MRAEAFNVEFDCEADYLAWVEKMRWPVRISCIYCTYPRASEVASRGVFQCSNPDCRRQFSAISSTIFHKTHLPLSKWFKAISKIADSSKKIPVRALQTELGVSYQTAWYLRSRIQNALRSGEEFLPNYVGEEFEEAEA